MSWRFHPVIFLQNLKWAFAINHTQEMQELCKRLERVERDVQILNPDAASFQCLRLYHDILESKEEQFREEINYFRRLGRLDIFPYDVSLPFQKPEVHDDPRRGMSYLVHEGKRLYYPASWSKERIAGSYLQCVAVEGILGNGCLEKSPHCYVSRNCNVREGDVVADLGAAEGLFALHVAERAGKLYVCECDPVWRAALEATFEPYADKTVLVGKAMGSTDGETTMRLESLLAAERGKRIIVKLDVEGAEYQTLDAAGGWLSGEPAVAVLCAAYHRQEDAERLERLVQGWGYKTEFSDGYMLFLYDKQVPPYFRRGVLRAWTPGFEVP